MIEKTKQKKSWKIFSFLTKYTQIFFRLCHKNVPNSGTISVKIFQCFFLPWPLSERQVMVMWPPCWRVTDSWSNWTDKNRHVCKARKWSRGVDCHDCIMTVSWLLEIDFWKIIAGNLLLEVDCWKLIAGNWLLVLEINC